LELLGLQKEQRGREERTTGVHGIEEKKRKRGRLLFITTKKKKMRAVPPILNSQKRLLRGKK